jgi:hypothetical protein
MRILRHVVSLVRYFAVIFVSGFLSCAQFAPYTLTLLLQRGGCGYENCQEAVACPGGGCTFTNCVHPTCPGKLRKLCRYVDALYNSLHLRKVCKQASALHIIAQS